MDAERQHPPIGRRPHLARPSGLLGEPVELTPPLGNGLLLGVTERNPLSGHAFGYYELGVTSTRASRALRRSPTDSRSDRCQKKEGQACEHEEPDHKGGMGAQSLSMTSNCRLLEAAATSGST